MGVGKGGDREWDVKCLPIACDADTSFIQACL